MGRIFRYTNGGHDIIVRNIAAFKREGESGVDSDNK
jgi:hypothetical protein